MSGASADTGNLEDATVLTNRQVEDFNTNGFLNIGQVLDNEGCERFRSEMLRVAAGIYDRAPIQLRNVNQDENAPVLQISNIWHSSSMFFDHMSLPAITDAVAELTGSAVLRVWHDQVQSKPANIGGSTAWHQDAPAWPILEPPDLITAWVPFQDTTIENGCMWMVPGSHLSGDSGSRRS